MIGYMAFYKELTYCGKQYEVGKTYEIEGGPTPFKQGFIFYKSISDCYCWNVMSEVVRICKVEVLGNVADMVVNNNIQYSTNKIRIVEEVLEDWKKKGNSEPDNTGYRNCGHGNSGTDNFGNFNTGHSNHGAGNTGMCNIGNFNAGNCNSGNYNSGNGNSLDYNSGDFNSGYWNSGTGNFGVFNTNKNTKIKMFDKESDWTIDDWKESKAYGIMFDCPCAYLDFVPANKMTEEEKQRHPEYETAGGFYKVFEVTVEEKQKWWDKLSEEDKQEIFNLPNFDKDKFKECTEIEV